MSRLTIPEPQIEIYADGFDENAPIKRTETANALSDLVERISDPMVIALDGGWGSGKSYFLKRWVGQHLKAHSETTQTVYFDAFKHDFIDEPLISLIGVIEDRFEKVEDKTWKDRLQSTISFTKKLIKPAARIGAAVVTGLASEVAVAAIGTEKIDTMADRAIDTGAKQIGEEASASIDELWKSEAGRREAMEGFRKSLIELTAPLQTEQAEEETDENETATSPHRKLVIVVDELDRCRPDYALALLEIIKHFFDVDHVHFVLGVNLAELENSVKARYGAGINAGLYLQKFVTLTMRLPDRLYSDYYDTSFAQDYLSGLLAETQMDQQRTRLIVDLVGLVRMKEAVSFRGMQRLFSIVQLAKIPFARGYPQDKAEQHVIASLCILKAFSPRKYELILERDIDNIDQGNKELELADIREFFWMIPNTDETREDLRNDLDHSWQYYLDPNGYSARFPETRGRTIPTRETRARQLNQLIRDHLEVFQLPPQP